MQWKQYKLSECLTVILRGRAGYELIYITNEAVGRVGYYQLMCVSKMQIALVPIQRKIKFPVGPCDFAPTHFNLVPSFPGYEIAKRLIFISCFLIFVFFWFKFQKATPLQEDNFTHASGVSFHYIVLHPVSSRASWTSGILVQSIRHSCLIGYHNI